MSIGLFTSENSLEFLIIRYNGGPLLFQEVVYPLSLPQEQPIIKKIPLYNIDDGLQSDNWWVILTNNSQEQKKIRMRLIRETHKETQVTLFTHYRFEEPKSIVSQVKTFYNSN